MKKFNKTLLGAVSGAVFAFLTTTSVFAAVSVKVTGDSVHEPGAHTAYTEWLDVQTDEAVGKTAESVVKQALSDAGYECHNSEWGYIDAVTTPGGEVLGEFTNGAKSGWMYFVNGLSPDVGIGDYIVADGDAIELHYYDNYGEVYGFSLTVNSDTENYTMKIYDKDGNEVIDYGWGYSLFPGEYTYTAESASGSLTGSFEVVNDDVEIELVFGGTVDVIWGDFDLNGRIDASDVSAVLQKALLSTFPAPNEDIIDVDKDGRITANDASLIFAKVLDGSFVLPCEG